MLYLLVEAEFQRFFWCQKALRGVFEEARKKKVAVRKIRSVGEISTGDGKAGVMILGASEAWIAYQVRQAAGRGAHAIALTNRYPNGQGGSFSTITMNIRDSMRLAVDYLHSLGCKRLALYGVNPHSSSDPWRAAVFAELTQKQGDVFAAQSSLENTFAAFWQAMPRYDGVICVSDYAAVSLVRRLRAAGCPQPGRLYIVGYGNMLLSQMSNPSITSISDDYEHFGQAALHVYQMVVREKSIACVNILLRSHLHIRETTAGLPCIQKEQPPCGAASLPPNLFFSDREIARLANLELLLNRCDKTDMGIIQGLLDGSTYAAMAARLYISETAVKYRTQKMAGICGVSSRAELTPLLREFF